MNTVVEFPSEQTAAVAGQACGSASAVLQLSGARLRREQQTMAAMISCYCRDHHSPGGHGLCSECQSLMDYATVRLARCRFGEAKPTCARCPVHCYQAKRREQVKAVMRYAGPRMLWQHPVLALRHWLDGYRAVPSLTREFA